MMRTLLALLGLIWVTQTSLAQTSFDYSLQLSPINITGLPGLHSYAFAQDNGKWLIIGGRRDGLHPRQPFNSFPQSQNNTDIYVIDINTKQFWSAGVSSLPTSIAEQLQATNLNFHQVGDTLYVIGGYAYSTTATDHITFSYLTTIDVPGMIQAVINNSAISSYCKQMSDTAFAVTGGHLANIADTFYLVGGHKFNGRYNPMGNPTYTQSYTNQIRKFTINNSGSQPAITSYTTITDPVHLRRRDYNLMPQIFPDGSEGFTISSGVFQQSADLPFLYPVDISPKGHTPQTSFNQYLSNYHSASVSLYDSNTKAMHMLFFGGMSQYYYQNGVRIKDDNVPFVNTISRVTRSANGTLNEYKLTDSMPSFKGASAEFILNSSTPHYESEIIRLHALQKDTVLIGHILGGISSSMLNPFTNNQTNNTSADNTIYEVHLIKSKTGNVESIDGQNPYSVDVYPSPASKELYINPQNTNYKKANYFITDVTGKLIQKGEWEKAEANRKGYHLHLKDMPNTSVIFVTVVFDYIYFTTKEVTIIR